MQIMRMPHTRMPHAALGRARRNFGPPLAEMLLPRSNLATRALTALIFVGLIALCAQVRIPLPGTPVPLTLQTFGVIMAGGVLGWRWGAAAAAAYYLIGLLGAPVFAGANGGWEYATGATGGYLLGFILAAGVAGLLTQIGAKRWEALWAMLAASMAIYIPGLIWLSFHVDGGSVLSAGLYPFIPGDLVKLAGAGLAMGGLWKMAERRAGGSRRG